MRVCAPSAPPAPRRFALAPALALLRCFTLLMRLLRRVRVYFPMGAWPIARRAKRSDTASRIRAPSKLRIRTAPAGSVRCGRHLIRARMRLCRLLALLAWLPALLSARRLRLRPRSIAQQRHPRVVMMQGAVSKEDAESNARLLKALFSGEESEDPVEEVDLMSTIFNAVEERAEKVPPLRTPPRTPRGRAEPLVNLP